MTVTRKRRAARWSVLGVVVVAGVAAGVAFSPILDVESVEVVGVPPERVPAVERAAGIDVGEPILGFLPGRAAARVRSLPWVADAAVVRDLPGTVRIEVVARVAVGWVEAGGRVLLVDDEGRVIEKASAAPRGVPRLSGVADVAPVGGEIRPRAVAAAAGALGAELRLRIGDLAYSDGALTAQVAFGPQLRFGSPERIALKARVAAAVLAALGTRPVTYVDVSVPAAPVSG